jgi:hypothetical protein
VWHTNTGIIKSARFGWATSYNAWRFPLEPPLRLADFIISAIEPILQEWEEFARTLQPAALNMTDKDL